MSDSSESIYRGSSHRAINDETVVILEGQRPDDDKHQTYIRQTNATVY